MAKINTVFGAIDEQELGLTLMHEHVWNVNLTLLNAFGNKWIDRDLLRDVAVKLFSDTSKRYGVKSVLDCTPINIGRDVRLIKEVAEKAGINMLVSTGFFYNEEPALVGKEPAKLIDLLLDECENGIENTGIRPAAIKCAVSVNGFTPLTKLNLQVMSEVCKKTNLPLFVHTEHRTCPGREVLDILEGHGVDLSRVVVSHIGDVNDVGYIEDLLNRGAYVGLDRFSQDWDNPLENRLRTMMTLIEDGYIDQLIVSHDLAVVIDWGQKLWLNCPEIDHITDGKLDLDYTYLFVKVFPELLKRGIQQEDIDKIMIRNPVSCLTGKR